MIKQRSTFALIFILNRSKVKKSGLCPIFGRISVDSKAVQFSAKIDIDPKYWDAKAGRATVANKDINRRLKQLTVQIEGYYNEILDMQGYVTAELVKNALNGIGRKKDKFLALFDEHNEEYFKRVGVDRKKCTYDQYIRSRRYLAEYINQKYNVEDMSFRQLDYSFIDGFDFYLRVDRNFSQNYISVNIINLCKIMRRAKNQGSLHRDPFFGYVNKQPDAKRRHLKSEEIDRIMNVNIESKRVCFTRDMFVFAMFTGLSYVDLRALSESNIYTESDGSMWIKINRQKTGGSCSILLLDIPIRIIAKYKSERKSDKIFNMITLGPICINLRKIEKMTDIERVTFHMSRHNFATHITLSQGVPIETVSKMMGHKSISTTQIYAKITNQKVNEDMKILSNRLTDRYSTFEDVDMPIGIASNQNFKTNKLKK